MVGILVSVDLDRRNFIGQGVGIRVSGGIGVCRQNALFSFATRQVRFVTWWQPSDFEETVLVQNSEH